jgi:hypothetical protein
MMAALERGATILSRYFAAVAAEEAAAEKDEAREGGAPVGDQQGTSRGDSSGSGDGKDAFMSWFSSLEYVAPEERRAGAAQAAAELYLNEVSSKGRRRRRRGETKGPVPRYMEAYFRKVQADKEAALQAAEAARPKAAERASGEGGAVKLPKLPRVATIPPRQLERTQSAIALSERESAAAAVVAAEPAPAMMPGLDFWLCADLGNIAVRGVGFVPTLAFDMRQRVIRWACFTEEARSFRSVGELTAEYAKVVQSLCHFGGEPLVLSRARGGTKRFLLSRADVVSELERACKRFSSNQCDDADELVLLQALVPPEAGQLTLVSKSKLTRKLERLAGVSDVHAQVLSDRDPASGASRQFIADVLSFAQARPAGGASARRAASTSAQGEPAMSKRQSELEAAFKWCIGDFCKSEASAEQLEAGRAEDKKQVVYKMVLQQRMGVTNTQQLSERLPANLRARMFETVKVCSICYDRLWELERDRIAEEQRRRERAKEQRQHEALKRLRAKCAKEAAERANERRRERKRREAEAAAAEADRADAEKRRAEQAKLARDAELVKPFLSAIVGEGHFDAADEAEGCRAPLAAAGATGVTASAPRTEATANVRGKRAKSAGSSTVAPQQAEAQEPALPAMPLEKLPPKSAEVEFPGISCSAFFGDDAFKLSICQGVMDALRAGKSARVLAPISLNNMSIDECRLVLRSLYLEFRGMCMDQGYFPDVPLYGENAVMLLQPLPIFGA